MVPAYMFERPILGRVKETPSGCLIFTGGRDHKGYGKAGGSMAHRAAYEAAFGPIPNGKQLDHTCHNEAVRKGLCKGGRTCPHRPCINAFHLEPATSRENTARGLNHVAVLIRATHCKHGHELTPDNTRLRKLPSGNTGRQCIACERQYPCRQKARKEAV